MRSFLHNGRCAKCDIEELGIGDYDQIEAFKNFRSFLEARMMTRNYVFELLEWRLKGMYWFSVAAQAHHYKQWFKQQKFIILCSVGQ